MVMGHPRKGIKLTYCTDTRPTDVIRECAKASDLFICEGMYGEDDKLANAKEKRHMMMTEAAELAKEAEVSELWLTHFSPATVNPQEFSDKVRRIFPRTIFPKDRRTVTLKFEED
jgi:ribonuclease Z